MVCSIRAESLLHTLAVQRSLVTALPATSPPKTLLTLIISKTFSNGTDSLMSRLWRNPCSLCVLREAHHA